MREQEVRAESGVRRVNRERNEKASEPREAQDGRASGARAARKWRCKGIPGERVPEVHSRGEQAELK